MLKTLDLAALGVWLGVERTARLAVALAAPALSSSLKALALLAKRPSAAKLLNQPLIRELRDILESPSARELRRSSLETFLSLKDLLDKSAVARRLLLALVAFFVLRAALWEESGPPKGEWKPYGCCVASFYDKGFLGKPTASGEIFSPYEFTAAHRALPFDTYLKLRNLENGRETVVRVNDRGPYVSGRDLDLSRAAAKALDMTAGGLARVELRILD